jgi:phage shock protein PspC (stress-responsive transcriptional regulator)
MFRDRYDRVFLGVCGGLARTSVYDVMLIRILFSVFAVLTLGLGVLVYLLLALIMSEG